ncbi:hypothetical protein V8D89_003616 [Ganoderma adspersum]
MKFLLATLFSLATFVLSTSVPNPIPGTGNVVLRDPSIRYNSKLKKYFVFSSDEGLKIFTSPHLKGPWTRTGSVLPGKCSKINLPGRCLGWSPDINYVNGRYVLYYAVSVVSSPNSSIGLATSPSMEEGTWTDHGEVFHSRKGDIFNAIGPNLIEVDGGLKLTFGSWNQGIFQVPLTNISKLAKAAPGTHLAGANLEPNEAGFMYKPKNSAYYYLFFSNGFTPLIGANSSHPRPAPGKEYKILVGRSKSVTGPFTDKHNNLLTKASSPPIGVHVLGSHDNIYAPGSESVYLDPVSGRDILLYHYVRNDTYGGSSYLGINYLDFKSGWPVVVKE